MATLTENRPVGSNVTDYIFSKLEFLPTPLQSKILTCRKRFVLVAGGEQAGKSMVASKFLVSRFLAVSYTHLTLPTIYSV